MNNVITGGQALKVIEANIRSEIANKDLWGDLNLSELEYEALKEQIKNYLAMDKVDIVYMFKLFPYAMTTFFVFMAKYRYDTNFWGLASQELSYNLDGLSTYIGTATRTLFKKNNFDFSDVSDEVRVNIAPILYEAGNPPESSLDALFYVLNYDSHNIFDPQLIIEDLIEMRTYHPRVAMQRFLERFRDDRAIEFVLEVHEAMRCVDQNMHGESHYIRSYSEWKENEKTKEKISSRKRKEFQTRPYLMFDNGKRGLCLVLPRIILSDEWIETTEWIIKSDDGIDVHKRMNVFGDEGKRYVESLTIPIAPARSYKVTLKDIEGEENSKVEEWEVNGIPYAGIIFFNAMGRMITPNYIQLPYATVIMDEAFSFIKTKNIVFTYKSYPTDRSGFKVAMVEPSGQDASMAYMSNQHSYVLSSRPQINLILVGTTLFNTSYEDRIAMI